MRLMDFVQLIRLILGNGTRRKTKILGPNKYRIRSNLDIIAGIKILFGFDEIRSVRINTCRLHTKDVKWFVEFYHKSTRLKRRTNCVGRVENRSVVIIIVRSNK